jgi:hypothetical protein
MRHINSMGHKDLGMLIASFLRDVTCDMLAEDTLVPQVMGAPPHAPASGDKPEDGWPKLEDDERARAEENLQVQVDAVRQEQSAAGWPEWARSWPAKPNDEYHDGRLMPGLWNTPAELGVLPRLRVLDGWNSDLNVGLPPFQPTCLSTRSTDPKFNLTPTETVGWEHWVHPEHLDKPYLVAYKPGSWARFDLDTSLGVVKVYALKSRSFGLGDLWCWIDQARDDGVRVEGYWDRDE